MNLIFTAHDGETDADGDDVPGLGVLVLVDPHEDDDHEGEPANQHHQRELQNEPRQNQPRIALEKNKNSLENNRRINFYHHREKTREQKSRRTGEEMAKK